MVAVKIVTHDRTLATLAETLRESALSTSIQHPNVVRYPPLTLGIILTFFAAALTGQAMHDVSCASMR